MRDAIPTFTRKEEPLPLSLILCGTKMATLCAASLHPTRGSMKAQTMASQMTGQLLLNSLSNPLIQPPCYTKQNPAG